ASVRRVDLGQPHLRLLRGRRGEWNVASLLRVAPGGKPPAFRGDIFARGLRLDLTDYRAVALPLPARNSGTFGAALRLNSLPTLQFDASGSVAGKNGGTLHLQGHVDRATGGWLLTVTARSAALPYWTSYFAKATRGVRLLSAS